MRKGAIFWAVAVLVFVFLAPSAQAETEGKNKLIVVELEEKILRFYEDGFLKKEFSIRIGKDQTPTPRGEGYIYEKRERPVFRYQDPPNRGKIIRWVELEDGSVVKVPYKKTRALGFRINGLKTDRYSLHSTSQEHTIGQAVSNGCIGLKVDDMLELFSLAEEGTRIIIK